MRQTFEIDGVLVNPKLRKYFDSTPNDKRSQKEINEFWRKPYIIIEELEQETWEEHYHRLKTPPCAFADEQIGTKEQYLKRLEAEKSNWLNAWHTGFRYNLRCLDGGAWDRSTNHGFYPTLEEAVTAAKQKNGTEQILLPVNG